MLAQIDFGKFYVFYTSILSNKCKDISRSERVLSMTGAYDNRDGLIWMDGKLIDWKSANIHILTHAMHYASSVFEGERCYNGKIFKSREHSERLKNSALSIDFEIPY